MPKKLTKPTKKIKDIKTVVTDGSNVHGQPSLDGGRKAMSAGQQVLRGLVVAATLPKTLTVLIEGIKIHPLYRKTFKQSKRYLVHDEIGASLGDIVEISQIRPMSKNKHFKVNRIIGKDIVAVVTEQLKEEAKEAIAEVLPAEETEEETKVVETEEKKVAPEAEKKGKAK